MDTYYLMGFNKKIGNESIFYGVSLKHLLDDNKKIDYNILVKHKNDNENYLLIEKTNMFIVYLYLHQEKD